MKTTYACFETGESLNILKNVILLEWERLVRQVIVTSRHEPSIILLDHLPRILNQLMSVLKTGHVEELELAKCHGYYRSAMTDFRVSDIITEYSLLREILITYLYPMGDLGCAKVIHKFIDIMTKISVVEFINEQLDQRTIPVGPEVSRVSPVIN